MNSREIKAQLQALRDKVQDDPTLDLGSSHIVLFLGEIAHQLAVNNETVLTPGTAEVSKADLYGRLDTLFGELRDRITVLEKKAASVDDLRAAVEETQGLRDRLRTLVTG